jgi:thioredoxin reductase (NADPH)
MSEAETLSAAVAAPEPAANPADPYEREAQTFPRLSREQVQRAQSFGRVEDLPKGAVLFRRGDRTVDFFLVLQGAIEIYDEGPDGAERVFPCIPSASSRASSTCSTTATSWSAAGWGRTGGWRA